MTNPNIHDRIGDPAELAALYASGAMTDDESAAFEAHLSDGCEACRRELRPLEPVVAALLADVQPATPEPPARGSLLARLDTAEADARMQIWRRWESARAGRDLFIVRKDESAWEDIGVAGVRVRRLFVDEARNQATMLVRMDAGTAYPRHVHNGPEECLVLEGELRVGDQDVLSAGDYQYAPAGSRHAVQSTDTGCLLMIVTSLTDEIEHD